MGYYPTDLVINASFASAHLTPATPRAFFIGCWAFEVGC